MRRARREEGREGGKQEGEGGGARTLIRQISSECVHCVGFWWPKTTIFANFDTLGVPVPTSFYQ